MNLIGSAQSTVALLLGIAALVLEVFAFVDAIRHRADAYVAAGKRTKQFWSIVTGVSALVGFVTFLSPLNMLGILAVVGAGIYLADVRPALQRVSGAGRGGQTHMGPYGPW
jgi:hypothetical protein